MRFAWYSILIWGFIGCGRTHPPEVRLRAYFSIPETDPVTVETIKKSLTTNISPQSSRAEVEKYIQGHGLGQDGLSECAAVAAGRKLRCDAFYFPPDDARLKNAYEVTFEFDKPQGRLIRFEVADIVYERSAVTRYQASQQ